MKLKINIILCDTFPGLLPSYIPSYFSMFAKLFDSVNDGNKYEIFMAMNNELPQKFNHGELYLITGCNLSAYDDIEWIKQLIEWIKIANTEKIKLAGICFGHQIIAQALGGKVQKAEVGWGTGIRESLICDDEVKRYFPDGKMHLLYNHHDQVTSLPTGARLIATSSFCPIESFRIGSNIITFQGHPEYVPQYNEHLINNFADNEPEDVKEKALDSIKKYEHQGKDVAKMMIDWVIDQH